MKEEFTDLVISGCDFSGTTTQLFGLADYLYSKNYKIRDLRGSEREAMFHSEAMKEFNQNYAGFGEFLNDNYNAETRKQRAIKELGDLMKLTDFKISSMIHNEISEYIDPNSADAWIMEEPTRRGAGQTVRGFELYRSQFGSEINPISAALAHQAYRSEEFYRFRKILRDNKKIIIRSRSEESACYQIQDEINLPEGISREQYLSLPGHKIAFGNSPTNIFLVVGPADWKPIDYATLKGQRCGNRLLDDHEKNFEYQIMVNKRYATDWIENLYEEGCKMHNGKVPEITRFDIYDSKEQIMNKMISKLESILESQEKPYISPIVEEE